MLDVISKRYKRVEIIILNPDSAAAAERGTSYIQDNDYAHKAIQEVNEYKNGIKTVLKNLVKAHEKNPHITVRLVDKIPAWKMVKVDREIWVQPIIAGTRSDHTTLYGYRNEPSSMYHTFFNKIESLWESAIEVDLSTYGQVNSTTVSKDNGKNGQS